MTDASSRIAVVALLGTAAATSLAYLAVRPAPPERMKGYGNGPIGMLGRWAHWVTRPLLRLALALRLSANAMTGIGLAITLLAGLLAGAGLWGWAGFFLVFGSWCDLIDGELARQTRTQGAAGAFLDSNLDRISEIALFAGLAASLPGRAGVSWAVGALAASLMVSYARARGEGLGVECPSFGMERPHRVVLLMFVLIATPFLRRDLAALVVEGACALVTLGAGATALGRMIVIHQRLRRAEERAPAEQPAARDATAEQPIPERGPRAAGSR